MTASQTARRWAKESDARAQLTAAAVYYAVVVDPKCGNTEEIRRQRWKAENGLIRAAWNLVGAGVKKTPRFVKL